MNSSGKKCFLFLVYHLPFLLQVSLLHQKFYSNQYQRYQTWLKVLRLLLLPLNICITLELKRKFGFTSAPFNLQFACWVIHIAMKSLEWGLVSSGWDDPTYHLRTEFLSCPNKKPITDGKGELKHNHKSIKPHSYKDVLIWSFHQLTSLRGINYNWGWRGRKNPIPSVTDTLRTMLVAHALQTIGLIGCMLSRDYGTPKGALIAMGFPEMIGLETIGELLSTLSWGLICAHGTEFSFGFLTLTSHLMTFLNQHVIKLPMDWWDLRLFVPLFYHPFKSSSLVSFWGSHWHQVYRRSFIFLGVLPATQMAQKLGLNFNSQRVFGLFGGFLVSAILHELVIKFVAPSPYKTAYDNTKNFPGSIFFFMMQPIGILIEPYVTRWIPGRLWVLIFILITAWPFKNQYTVHYPVIDDLYPPLKEWTLFNFFWPPSIMRI